MTSRRRAQRHRRGTPPQPDAFALSADGTTSRRFWSSQGVLSIAKLAGSDQWYYLEQAQRRVDNAESVDRCGGLPERTGGARALDGWCRAGAGAARRGGGDGAARRAVSPPRNHGSRVRARPRARRSATGWPGAEPGGTSSGGSYNSGQKWTALRTVGLTISKSGLRSCRAAY